MPGAPPPGMMAPPHPSAARLNDLLEFVKAEFEQVAGEGGMLRAQKDEYEAMSKLFCTFEMIMSKGLTFCPRRFRNQQSTVTQLN